MEIVERTQSRRGTAGSDRRPAYPSFERLLGPSAWARVPAAVRARFSGVHAQGSVTRYVGTMRRVEASAFGYLFAQISRLFDTPVAPHTGNEIEAVVNVYPSPDARGVVWERIYHFRGRAPVTVRSTKCLDRDGRLIESLGRGLRMRLSISEEAGVLKFTSTGYYLELFGMSVSLPRWFPPGTTYVVHKDEGGGRFRFTMYTKHPWLGAMYFQEGTFEAMEDDS